MAGYPCSIPALESHARERSGRQRPLRNLAHVVNRLGNDPCRWFEGKGRSFPSEEATASMALVMPYVLEYGPDNPAAYALLALPAWVGVGRIKNRAHWTSDVLAGWGFGLAWAMLCARWLPRDGAIVA